MWTIEKVRIELNNLREADHLPPITCPVRANKRLTATLGRVRYCGHRPEFIEFSQKLLDEGTDNDVINVIKHEYVHYFLLVTTNEKHGHDATFRAKCAEIGCEHDRSRNDMESDGFKRPEQTKYEIWCEDCQDIVANYHRMCKTLRIIDYCKCGRCGGNQLKVIQNW